MYTKRAAERPELEAAGMALSRMRLDLAGFHVLDYFRPSGLGSQLSHLGRPLYRAAIGAGEVGFGLTAFMSVQ